MAIDWDGLVLAPLMSSGIFGETVQPVYTPAGGAAFALDGVFDDGFRAIDPLGADGVEISTHAPVLGVRLAQFPPGIVPTQNDTVTVLSSGLTYVVKNPRPDGKGWVLLQLMEVT